MTQSVVSELIDLMQLERLEQKLFRGQSRDIGTKYVFGGQVLGQALSTAQQTMSDPRSVHSLHAYFLRAGDIEQPIIYDVECTREGKSFSTRRVTAIQHGETIFVMAASFQIDEGGAEHQDSMPNVPKPEDLADPDPIDPAQMAHVAAKFQRWMTTKGPFQFRYVYPRDEIKVPKRPPVQPVWFKLREPIDAPPALHRSLLAYASDFHLIGTTTFPHGISYLTGNVQMASLDHAMWFHRDFRVDDWLLYSCDSPSAQGARGLARGQIYTRDGVLVASTAQEGMIRIVPAAEKAGKS